MVAPAVLPGRRAGFIEICGWAFVCSMPLIGFPIGALAIITLLALLPYLLFFRSGARLSVPVLWLALIGAYQICSALLSGASPGMFADFSFWRRDGKFYIAYLPLLVASLMALRLVTVAQMLRVLTILAAVPAVLGIAEYALALAGIHPVSLFVVGSSGGLTFTIARGGSHNAVGGFYAVLAVLAMGQVLAGGWSPRWWLAVMALGLAAVLSLSRAFAFALVLVAGPAGVIWGGRRVLRIMVLAALVAAPFLAGGFLRKIVELRNPEEVYNARTRILYWLRAAEYIGRSPWLGIGWSRFNDYPVPAFHGVPRLLQWPDGAPVVNSDDHAHNAVLMIWAETGLVGLLLWSGFLGSLFRIARGRYRDPTLSPAVRGLAYGTVMGFGVLLAASLVANNIVTPSSVWPAGFFAGAMLGMVDARQPWRRPEPAERPVAGRA